MPRLCVRVQALPTPGEESDHRLTLASPHALSSHDALAIRNAALPAHPKLWAWAWTRQRSTLSGGSLGYSASRTVRGARGAWDAGPHLPSPIQFPSTALPVVPVADADCDAPPTSTLPDGVHVHTQYRTPHASPTTNGTREWSHEGETGPALGYTCRLSKRRVASAIACRRGQHRAWTLPGTLEMSVWAD